VIQSNHTKRAEEILNSGNDKALLKLFRYETTLIVLMVRVRNQERQEQYKQRVEDKNGEWSNAFAEFVSERGTE